MNFYYICTIYICTTSVHFTPALRLYGKNILECYRNLCPVYFIFCPSFCALLFSRAGVWVPPGEVGYDTAMPSSGNPFTTGFHFPTQRSVLLQKRGDDAIFFVAQRKKKAFDSSRGERGPFWRGGRGRIAEIEFIAGTLKGETWSDEKRRKHSIRLEKKKKVFSSLVSVV